MCEQLFCVTPCYLFSFQITNEKRRTPERRIRRFSAIERLPFYRDSRNCRAKQTLSSKDCLLYFASQRPNYVTIIHYDYLFVKRAG